MKLCKCKRIKEYWDAVGNPEEGYFSRRRMLFFLICGAIPIFGQVLLIIILIFTPLRARSEEDRVKEQYRLDYIERLIKKDNKKRKKT